MPGRAVPPRLTADEIAPSFAGPLPEGRSDPAEVIDLLAALAEPGLMAMPSGRFFGWVIGGALPAALAADWLVSAWDQNAGMRYATPAAAAAEEAAGGWLLDVLGLPAGADVGFVTGATMANFSGLAAARYQVLAQVGWDVNAKGLNGSPPIRVIVGAERHSAVDVALRYLGLGEPTPVASDDQGRIDIAALAAELDAGTGPTIVCLQAGNVHSGAFDDVGEAARVAHQHGTSDARPWVHVDGAFGLWAAASPNLRHLVPGLADADSWATDAHKTLNVPYDCGVVIVAQPTALRAALGVRASYLISAEGPTADPDEKAPELSRRARGVPVWAALRSLGRNGVADMVEGFVRARASDRRRDRDDRGCRGAQRRGVHPGLRRLRGRRAHPGDNGPTACRRDGVDVGLALARARRVAGVGQQLVDRRGRRRGIGRCGAQGRERRAAGERWTSEYSLTTASSLSARP